MTTNTNSDAFTRLRDDLLWLHARANPDDGLREAVEAMIADYADDANRYSDGSEVWEWYGEFPGYYFAATGELHLPPHRRNAGNSGEEPPTVTTTFDEKTNVVDALTEFIIQQGAIKFGELADYLKTLGVNIAGDEELTGEHVNQPHVRGGTTLSDRVSAEYVEIVEALFNTRPVMLEIGDPACFANHEAPWWVAWAAWDAWTGHPAALT